MANIQERYGKLVVDFRYQGVRCRETTNLEDTAQNRKLLKKRSVHDKFHRTLILSGFCFL
ncbi:Arm DNA-binding domain-containing protein, partial [Acinetobacter parvus]|uniref:Arm DNA-binding domain-containing protein n=1 Tax=Acinetobacter parvus TaxID=134533 RepID=UPI002FE1BE73